MFRTFYPFLKHAYRLPTPGGVLTYFSDEATWFSDEQVTALREVGVTKIDGDLVPVTPPQGWLGVAGVILKSADSAICHLLTINNSATLAPGNLLSLSAAWPFPQAFIVQSRRRWLTSRRFRL